MITIEQAKKLQYHETIHVGTCHKHIGPRGRVSLFIARCRVNGRIKLWKRLPHAFRLPLKAGLWEFGYLTEKNAHTFHVEKDCPILASLYAQKK